MAESFGARLRRQREQQNIALATIAEQTKIKASLLEALEHDDVSHWPSGIFRRAYIRSYAHAIGLCPDDIVREFQAVHPDPDEDLDRIATAASGADSARAGGGPPTRFRYMVGSAIASLSRLRRGSPGESAEPVPVAATIQQVSEDVVPDERLPEPEIVPLHEFTTMDGTLEGGADTPCPTSGVDRASAPANTAPANEDVPPSAPDFLAVANLCTTLGTVENAGQLQTALQELAAIVEASGLIVWMWDAAAAELRPALVHGYSERVVAQLPGVPADADNVTAEAFRTAETCIVDSSGQSNGALVIPLLVPGACAGVLALELRPGGERHEFVRAAATIFAALLAQLIGGATVDEGQQSDPMLSTSGPTTPVRVNMRSESYRGRRHASSGERFHAAAADRRRASMA